MRDIESRSDVSARMRELGKRGGKVGGRRRADVLSPERRREIASHAAKSRWKKATLRTILRIYENAPPRNREPRG
jgi:hypothetical protein